MLLIILVFLIGCNDEPTVKKQNTTIPTVEATSNIGNSAVNLWFSLGDKISSGKELTAEDFAPLLDLPVYNFYTDPAGIFNSNIMLNVTRHVFNQNPKSKARKPKRTDMVDNFNYINSRREKLNEMTAVWSDEEYPQQIHQLLIKYLPKELEPSHIDLQLMVCVPSINYGGGNLVGIDAGLALATPDSKIINLTAAHCYRTLMGLETMPYEATTGKSALRQTFNQIRMEAIASVIEDYPEIWFMKDHPILNKSDDSRLTVFTDAPFIITRVNGMLKQLFSSRETLDNKGATIDDLLRFHKSYQGLGFAMATLIVDQLGEDRLIASANSSVIFLQAYQEAALTGNATGDLAKLHPFDENVLSDLVDLFPTN
jgi:hypothetical protein